MIMAIDMVKLLSSQQKCPKQESNNFVIIIMLNYFTNGNRAKNSKISSATNIHRKVLGVVGALQTSALVTIIRVTVLLFDLSSAFSNTSAKYKTGSSVQ